MVYQNMSGGSLFDVLIEKERYKEPQDWPTIVRFAKEAAAGVVFLHEQGVSSSFHSLNDVSHFAQIVHRDLALRNLLLDDGMHARVADFGMVCLEILQFAHS